MVEGSAKSGSTAHLADRPTLGETKRGRREGDGKKGQTSRQLATNVMRIYDSLQQVATFYNLRLFMIISISMFH